MEKYWAALFYGKYNCSSSVCLSELRVRAPYWTNTATCWSPSVLQAASSHDFSSHVHFTHKHTHNRSNIRDIIDFEQKRKKFHIDETMRWTKFNAGDDAACSHTDARFRRFFNKPFDTQVILQLTIRFYITKITEKKCCIINIWHFIYLFCTHHFKVP